MRWEGEHPLLGRRQAVVYKVDFEPKLPHTLPSLARFTVDRRMLPGDDPATAVDEVLAAIGDLGPYTVTARPDVMMLPSLVDPSDPGVRALQATIEAVRGAPAPESLSARDVRRRWAGAGRHPRRDVRLRRRGRLAGRRRLRRRQRCRGRGPDPRDAHPRGTITAPGWTVGMPRVKSRATQGEEREDRRARSAARRCGSASLVSTTASAVSAGTSCLVERGLEVLVGEERHAACEVRLRLRGDAVGDVGVVLHPGEERCGQRGDEYGAGQGGADRRAELGARVLQPADLAALLVGDGGHGHAAQLRGQRAEPGAGEQQRPGHDLGAGARRRAARSAGRCRRTAT